MERYKKSLEISLATQFRPVIVNARLPEGNNCDRVWENIKDYAFVSYEEKDT